MRDLDARTSTFAPHHTHRELFRCWERVANPHPTASLASHGRVTDASDRPFASHGRAAAARLPACKPWPRHRCIRPAARQPPRPCHRCTRPPIRSQAMGPPAAPPPSSTLIATSGRAKAALKPPGPPPRSVPDCARYSRHCQASSCSLEVLATLPSIIVFTRDWRHHRIRSPPHARDHHQESRQHQSTPIPRAPSLPRRRAAGLSPVAPQTRDGRDERGHGVRDLRALHLCGGPSRLHGVLGARRERRAARRRASPAARARAR